MCSFNSTWRILIVPMVLLVFPLGVLYLCFGARQITSNVLCILAIKGYHTAQLHDENTAAEFRPELFCYFESNLKFKGNV